MDDLEPKTCAERDAWPAGHALATAVALGILGDLLLHGQAIGINLTVWLALAAVAVGAGRRGGRSSGMLALLPLAAAAPIFALRDGGFLHLLAGGLVLTALGAALLREPLRSGLTAWAAAGALAAASIAVLGVRTVHEARRPGSGGGRRTTTVVFRGTLAAGPALLLFGALFASADPLFGWYVHRALDLGVRAVLEHTALALVLAWGMAGILHATRAISVPDPAVPRGPLARWGAELLVALLLIDLLFLAFLGVQARSLFGGAGLVEATTGMTYAQYARQGFFQLVAVAALALPLVLALEWAVPPGASRRRPFTVLAGTLQALVLVVLASAAHRMALYQAAYGWTELRLYTTAFMTWLGLVCLWLGATALRGRRDRFAAGALLGAVAIAVGLTALNPGGWIVRANAARAAAGGSRFDAVYASRLGADAAPALLEVLPVLPPIDRCRVMERLVQQWAGGAETELQDWNLSRWRARRAVAARELELRASLHQCGPPDGTRVGR